MTLAATLRPPASRAGTILAFDFGTRRIGVAVGETALRLAHPLATIAADNDDDRLAAIAPLVGEWQPALLVVGLPTHADGTPHAMTARAQKFARRLESRFQLAVELVDERFTTQAATVALAGAGIAERGHKSLRDQVAAQIILQAYLDQRTHA
ncbi:MAG: Holliday junction resolvase RuvX [Betaproteobacteria bacterium]